MRSLFSVIVPAALVVASMAQTPAVEPGQADKKQPDSCTVSGRVVTAAEGAPIKAARVGLVERDARRQTHIFAAFTDNDGRFEIKKIDPGRYEFVLLTPATSVSVTNRVVPAMAPYWRLRPARKSTKCFSGWCARPSLPAG